MLILTEAGGKVGYGHLGRCLSLKRVSDCVLVKQFGHIDENEHIRICDWYPSLDYIKKMSGQHRAALIDSYSVSINFLSEIQEIFDRTIMLDDYNRCIYPVDIIINPGIMTPCYTNQKAEIFSGAKYIILDKEIVNSPKKSKFKKIKKILVYPGGANKGRVLEKLLKFFNDKEYIVDILFDKNRISVQTYLTNKNFSFFSYVSKKYLANLMTDSDVLICSAGQIMHEAVYLGVPCLPIQTGEDQKYNVKGYKYHGITPFQISANDCFDDALSAALKGFSDVEFSRKISELGCFLVDGKGRERILRLLDRLCLK